MKTIEILKTRKEEIIEKTLELMPDALSGDIATRTFYFEIKNGKLTVNYLYYAGHQILSDNCFYTVHDYETPDAEDYGYETLKEMGFEACGFDEHIKNSIENNIDLLV